MRAKSLLSILVWAASVSAQGLAATPIDKAIKPTTLGQIGIWEISDLPPESYHAPHAHTEYWDQEPSTTKWIGVNTEYLTDLPVMTTDTAGDVIQTTIPAQIVASTVTAAASGYEIGDVAFALSPKFLDALTHIAEEVEATASCSAKKRALCDRIIKAFAQRVADEIMHGSLSWVLDNPNSTVTAEDVAKYVNFITDARVLSVTSIAVAAYELGLKAVFKLVKGMTSDLSSKNQGGDSESKRCPLKEELQCLICAGQAKVCTTAFKGCPCSEEDCPSGENKPKCDNEKCSGNEDNKCTADNEGCECNRFCPEKPEEWPFCNECGGRRAVGIHADLGTKGLCIGIKEKIYQFAKCPCYDFPEPPSQPYKRVINMTLATSTLMDQMPPSNPTSPPAEATPANHECHGAGPFQLDTNTATDNSKKYCSEKANADDTNWLRKRPINSFSNAVIAEYPVDGGHITIYAYMDDACTGDGIDMVEDDCVAALTYLVNNCGGNGGGANIRCQYFDIAPMSGAIETGVPDSGP